MAQQTWYFEEVPANEEEGSPDPPPETPEDSKVASSSSVANKGKRRLLQKALQFRCTTVGCEEAKAAPSPRGGCSWTPVLGGRIILFGGADAEARHYNDAYCFNVNSQQWEPAIKVEGAPSARSGHAATSLGRFVYVHGGMNATENATFNDLWRLDTASWTWHEVPCVDSPPRNSHSALVIRISAGSDAEIGASGKAEELQENSTGEENFHLLLFGGAAPDGPVNDVHVLSLSEAENASSSNPARWRKVPCSGEAPSPREMHAECLVAGSTAVMDVTEESVGENPSSTESGVALSSETALDAASNAGASSAAGTSQCLLAMGGRSAEGVVNGELFRLDLQAWSWKKLPDAPVPRCAHAAVALSDGRLACFLGGWDGGTTISNGILVFDTVTETWEAAAVSPAAAARFAHRACAEGDRIFVFGGINPSEELAGVEMLALEG